MISDHDDQGILVATQLQQRLHESSEVMIHEPDLSIVTIDEDIALHRFERPALVDFPLEDRKRSPRTRQIVEGR
jgi:hypothetical protein